MSNTKVKGIVNPAGTMNDHLNMYVHNFYLHNWKLEDALYVGSVLLMSEIFLSRMKFEFLESFGVFCQFNHEQLQNLKITKSVSTSIKLFN
jgi:hypothetical protein